MLLEDNELFIFDWDGTLVTSGFLIRVSKLLKARYRFDYIIKRPEVYRVKSIRHLMIKEETGRIFSTIYRLYSWLTVARMKPGAEELLKLLKEKGKKVCIFSDSNATRLLCETKSTKAIKYVDFVLSADSIKRYKPDPSGILLITDRYKAKKSKTVYVGDMVSDIFASRFAGVNSCIVADGLDPLPLIKKGKPDYLFSSTESLLNSIKNPKTRQKRQK